MDEVDSLDSSRDLQPIHAKSFINRLHLVLLNGKILFPKKILGEKLNTAWWVQKKFCKSLCLWVQRTVFTVFVRKSIISGHIRLSVTFQPFHLFDLRPPTSLVVVRTTIPDYWPFPSLSLPGDKNSILVVLLLNYKFFSKSNYIFCCVSRHNVYLSTLQSSDRSRIGT